MASTPPAGSSQHKPDWDKFPNLDNVISKEDVDKKGTGSYSADYINWCKAAQLLREHAQGWQFELRTTLDANGHETDVFRAPNGSGYLKGFFRAPTGSGFLDTPDFPQAIMNNRNQPMQWDAITARDVTDTHRRCMCTAAAAHFGLAWQLWAKVDIENPMRDEEPAPAPKATPKKAASSKKAVNTPPQAEQTATAEGPSVQDQVLTVLAPLFKEYGEEALDTWRSQYKAQFKLKVDVPTAANITTQEQFAWTENYLNNFKPAKQA